MERANAIELGNLFKGYKRVPVLDDVSFTVGLPTVFAVRHSAATRAPLVTDGAIEEDRTSGLC